jgi:TonB family protein
MSLLKRTKSSLRRNIVLVSAAALLLAVPGVVAAAFAINFTIEPGFQEPSREAKERREKEEQEMKARWETETQELKQRIERETDATVKAKLEQELRQRMEERDKTVFTYDRDGRVLTARVRSDGWAIEQQQKNELAKAAKISMDQAIQIATGASPGKVIECSLVGERWKEPGELAKPSRVLYHVVILSGDEANPVTYHVMVNAVDGSVVTVNKEERKRENPEFLYERRREPIKGGVLNGKAISLPAPEYPEIAKQAKASGSVTVEITVDETGHVIEARAVSGHPLLQAAAVSAARQSVFAPTKLSGEPVQVSGALIYNFVAQ